MRPVFRNERGMALALAIFALVVVFALVAGAFFAATQEQRTAENSRRAGAAFGAAEAGATHVITNWAAATYNKIGLYPANSLAIGSATIPVATPLNTGKYYGTLYQLDSSFYLVDITGMDNASATPGLGGVGTGGRQRIGLLLRSVPFNFPIKASLTVNGNVNAGGNAGVSGYDSIPPGWSGCPATNSGLPGVTQPPGDTTQVSGSATVVGNPAVQTDSSINDSTFNQFGDLSYNDIAAMATITLPGGNYKTDPTTDASGNCDVTNTTNWGDGMNPTGACASYWPIIHITGDATLNGDQGQGILLVDGDLSVQGSYQFFGITLVRGTFSTAGGGSTDAHFYGGVMAGNVDLGTVTLQGHATLLYSNCAIINTLQNTQVASALKARSWVQLF